jgi:hypothetical protein
MSDPSFEADVANVNQAIESLNIVNCVYQIPPHVPRPRAQTMVNDFTKKIHAQGYINVIVELPSWGNF